jgi:hypothetical protein
MPRRPLDLTGQTFGRLTAMRPVGRVRGSVLWECRCSCGATVRQPARGLREGEVISCGCYRAELGARSRARLGDPGAKYAELRQAGWTLQRIADMFGVSRQTVSQVLKKRRPAAPITATSKGEES